MTKQKDTIRGNIYRLENKLANQSHTAAAKRELKETIDSLRDTFRRVYHEEA